jgi:hypothetical protein
MAKKKCWDAFPYVVFQRIYIQKRKEEKTERGRRRMYHMCPTVIVFSYWKH